MAPRQGVSGLALGLLAAGTAAGALLPLHLTCLPASAALGDTRVALHALGLHTVWTYLLRHDLDHWLVFIVLSMWPANSMFNL